VLLELMEATADRQVVIDSLPVPVLQFHLVPGSAATPTGRRPVPPLARSPASGRPSSATSCICW
jgi:hypothetical protein